MIAIPLTITAVFQDEARWLPEWIEFHRLVGAERFLLYNNFSSDSFDEALRPYTGTGLVELVDWPVRSEEQYDAFQCEAYRDAVRRTAQSSKWLAIIDIDEFLVPVRDANLVDLLSRFESAPEIGGVCGAWVCFGTSDVERVPGNRLMIETLVRSGDGLAVEGRFPWEQGSFKSIVRPDRVIDVPSPHFARYQPGIRQVPVFYDQIQINHYWTRDASFFRDVKVPRKTRWSVSPEMSAAWAAEMNNTTAFAAPILRFAPALRERLQLPSDR